MPEASYAMDLRPSMLTYDPENAGRLLPKERGLFTGSSDAWQPETRDAGPEAQRQSTEEGRCSLLCVWNSLSGCAEFTRGSCSSRAITSADSCDVGSWKTTQ
jgi:hypothetical protein